MNCPNCGSPISESQHFCSLCGAPISTPNIPKKKSSAWPPLIIMAIMIALSLMVYCMTVPNASVFGGDTPWFSMDGNTLYFNPDQYTGGSELTIPDTVNGKSVLKIGDSCFSGNTQLSAVILPDGLQEVGDKAFYNCTALRGIYIPKSVVSVGNDAFHSCTSMEAIWINREISSIGTSALQDCSSLKYVFFVGFYQQWIELYDSYIGPNTHIYSMDGINFQSLHTP